MNAEEIRDRRAYKKCSHFLHKGEMYWRVEFGPVAGKFVVLDVPISSLWREVSVLAFAGGPLWESSHMVRATMVCRSKLTQVAVVFELSRPQ